MSTVRDTRLWHPFTDMGAVRGSELLIARGEDVWVWDRSGRRYLDAAAGLWYANVGHGRREIAAAVAEQMGRLETYPAIGEFATEPARALAERLAELAPVPDPRVFLVSGGGDGIETAAKLARRYWTARGAPERTHIISRTRGYHGTHGFGTSMAGLEPFREGVGPLMPGTSHVAHDSLGALERELERVGPQRVAAFFFEPVIGAGGVVPPPAGYLEGAQRICREAGVLFVADDVICGFGRLGEWFGVRRWALEPDMIVFAKGVTSGYLPLGGVVVSGAVAEPFWAEADGPLFRHGVTHSAHASCCAAALANLAILEREGLVGRGRELEGHLMAALAPLAAHPVVAELRGGTGLMAALELDAVVPAGAGAQLHRLAREAGVIVRAMPTAVAVSPPLTATREHFDLIAAALRTGLEGVNAAVEY